MRDALVFSESAGGDGDCQRQGGKQDIPGAGEGLGPVQLDAHVGKHPGIAGVRSPASFQRRQVGGSRSGERSAGRTARDADQAGDHQQEKAHAPR